MTREDQLNFCSICTHGKYDAEQGILCGLSNQLADFDTFCGNFIEDTNKTVTVVVRRKRKDSSIRAGRGVRLINSLIDSIAIVVIFFLLAGLVSMIQGLFYPDALSVLEDENSILSSVLAFVSLLFYYTLFEYKTGQTLGKRITKTKVVAIHGEDPSLSAILVRTLCRFIPFEELSFLVSNSYGWHDRLSNTKVVNI